MYIKKASMCILVSSILISGCQVITGDLLDSEQFMVVTQKGRTVCYTRMSYGVPFDQVCQKGDVLRYTVDPKVKTIEAGIPNYVIALFEEHGGTPPSLSVDDRNSSYEGR